MFVLRVGMPHTNRLPVDALVAVFAVVEVQRLLRSRGKAFDSEQRYSMGGLSAVDHYRCATRVVWSV